MCERERNRGCVCCDRRYIFMKEIEREIAYVCVLEGERKRVNEGVKVCARVLKSEIEMCRVCFSFFVNCIIFQTVMS